MAKNPEKLVDMTTYTPLPESERLPFAAELEQESDSRSFGMTPLDDILLDQSFDDGCGDGRQV